VNLRNRIGHKVAFATVGLFGLGASVAVPVTATATGVDGCGEEPEGGTLSRDGDICQVVFDNAGSYTYTLPEGISGLHALLVGGGGGANDDFGGGYAGDGGFVVFEDLTLLGGGDVVSGVVGAGGLSSDSAQAGDTTTLEVNGVERETADGGDAGSVDPRIQCGAGDFALGSGNGGDNLPTYVPFSCVGSTPGVGVTPSAFPESPVIFSSLSVEYGGGGTLIVDGNLGDPADGTGHGARVATNAGGTTVTTDPRGAHGGVVFRFYAFTTATVSDSDSFGQKLATAPEERADVAAIHLDIMGKVGDHCSAVTVLQYGEGLGSRSTTTLTVASTGATLVSGQASKLGNYTSRTPLPSTLTAGTYTLAMTSFAPDGQALSLTRTFSVDANCQLTAIGQTAGLAHTGVSPSTAALALGASLLLVGAGAGLMFTRRRLAS